MQQDAQILIQGLSEFIAQATPWEQGFYSSVKTQFETRKSLSPRQIELLNKIASNYSKEAIEERAEWDSSWDSRKQEIARVCAQYYEGTGYYHSLCKAILYEPDFVPTLKQYKSMCENKYASKVLEAHFKEPSFPIGSLVALRSRAAELLCRKLKSASMMVVVLRTDLPITSAAKGCKRYQVVQVGGSKTFEVEERDLKGLKKGAKCTAKTIG